MAGIGAGVTSKALGELIFGQPKRKTVFANDALARLQTDPDKYPQLLSDLMGSGKKAATGFASALEAGAPEAARLQAEDIANLGALTKEGIGYDPLRYYNELLASKVSGPSGIKSFIPDLMGAARANLARNRLRLGINGSAPTSYDTVASLSALGGSLAPILSNIYSTTGAEAAGTAGQRLANIGSTVSLMRERAGIPDRLANRALLPFQAESDILGRQFDLGGRLGDTTKANIQGYEMKTNPWANLFAATGEATDSAVDTGMDLAKMYFGGGMGGGMGGMGGRPTPSLTPDNSIWGNQPSIFDRPAPTSYPGFDPYGNAVATRYPSLPNVWNVPPSQTMSYPGFDTGSYPVSNRYPVTPNFWGG